MIMGIFSTDSIQKVLFKYRALFLSVFCIITVGLFYQSTQLRLDAGFTKNIPLNHPYMQTYMKHVNDFGGANSILVSVCDESETIFNTNFMQRFKEIHDQLFFINGIDRSSVDSLYSSSTRFTEVVEDGFAGGPVIPADFNATRDADLRLVASNVDKAGIVGRKVSDDFSCAMVKASLLELDPITGEKLDTLTLANELETSLRGKFEKDGITVHIIGFAKMIGDVANGATDVLVFFVIAILITGVFVYLFSRSVMLTLLPLLCSFVAVIWQLGLLTSLGFGIDPMSILVPFLVFAIGVSHGVQMINAAKARTQDGMSCYDASMTAFKLLLIPGGIALLSDTIGFMTLLVIDIGIIRELAIAASIGVAVIILTNLILLPLLMSYAKSFGTTTKTDNHDQVWEKLSIFAKPEVARYVLAVTAVLFAVGVYFSQQMKIGDLHAGAPALHETSRYNQDTFLISDRYEISVDYMSVLVESTPEACTSHSFMTAIDDFQWRMANVAGVQSAISLPSVAKIVNGQFNEGNPKWRVLPRTQQSLVQAIARVPTTSGLLNSDCSVMPVILFMEDHKAQTINRVVAAVKEYAQVYGSDELRFELASGPVGVMAAKNQAVKAAQLPMMIYVFAAVIILCLISFRSVRATLVVVVPLYVVSVLAQALMTGLQIGLTVSTLPVIALGVGIGVDYGIYILSSMNQRLKQGESARSAYLAALKERGSAVLFTGITLAIGVSTWVFSALKFQVDMGILLTFMFLVNMLGAIIVLPALASYFWKKN